MVAAPDPVEFERRANPQLLDGCESFFADVSRRADGFFEIFHFPGECIECFAFGGRDFGDVIVEPGDEHTEILVVQLPEEFGEDSERIWNGAAVHARMEIALGAGEFDLVVVEAAQTVSD